MLFLQKQTFQKLITNMRHDDDDGMKITGGKFISSQLSNNLIILEFSGYTNEVRTCMILGMTMIDQKEQRNEKILGRENFSYFQSFVKKIYLFIKW